MLTRHVNLWRSTAELRFCSRAAAQRLLSSASLDNTNRLDDGGASALSPTFLENARSMEGLVSHICSLVDRALLGGGQAAIDRHKGRSKLLPRERIAALLDPGSPFLELSQLAGHQLYGKLRSIDITVHSRQPCYVQHYTSHLQSCVHRLLPSCR